MKLPDYIRKMGVAEFARRFSITERAARSYQCGARRPRPELAARIVKTTPVTWIGIYQERKP